MLNIQVKLSLQFALISYTHKHILNEVTDKTCSHAHNKGSQYKTVFHTNVERKLKKIL